VWTYEWPAGWVQHGGDISVTFTGLSKEAGKPQSNGVLGEGVMIKSLTNQGLEENIQGMIRLTALYGAVFLFG